MSAMRKPRHRSRRALSDINVVPYIDVMLVLLVIFMVTAPMVNSSVVNVPTVANSSQTPQHAIEVTIKSAGELQIADRRKPNLKPQRIIKAQLITVLHALMSGEDRLVLIAADKNIKYDIVMNVLSELQRAKFKTVSLLVRQNDA